MSAHTGSPPQHDLAPTRRAVVRATAWSVPVLSIAAAAPAFATSANAIISGGIAEKWGTGQDKHVSWDLTLTNGPVAIDTVSILFTYAPSGGGSFVTFTIFGFLPIDTSWTFPPVPGGGSDAVNATHTNGIAANSTTRIHTDFAGSDNSAGSVSATATITYVDSTTLQPTPVIVTWGPGSQHVHPA